MNTDLLGLTTDGHSALQQKNPARQTPNRVQNERLSEQPIRVLA